MTYTLLRQAFFMLLAWLAASAAYAFDENSLVVRKCIYCHAYDAGKMSRVSDIRTTPEEWTIIVDRMHRLHHMPLTKGEMAALLKELCATQSLTPKEAAAVAYVNLFNNPQTVESPTNGAEKQLFTTCVRCHSAAKIRSYRMTPPAWHKLRNFHLYIDPAIMYQMREMYWRKEADAVLDWLADKLPYRPAWEAPPANPAGAWLVLGHEPGRGDYRGSAELKSLGADEFALHGTLRFADGTTETFTGNATLYGGYALRTHTRHNGSATLGAFSLVDGIIHGARQHPAPDFRTASSTWYPASQTSRVLRLSPAYLLSGEETHLLIEGMGLPTVQKSSVRVTNKQVEVLQAATTSAETIEVTLVYRGKTNASTRIKINRLEAGSLQLAPRIDYLRISPATGRARVNGGKNYPAEGVQFQALAYSNGPDSGSPDDDILLGPVPAVFSLAKEVTSPGDDDLTYLGAIESNGTYIPSGDYNPIPAREQGAEGTGMARVIASYSRGAEHYTATARLVVTVPDFVQRLR